MTTREKAKQYVIDNIDIRFVDGHTDLWDWETVHKTMADFADAIWKENSNKAILTLSTMRMNEDHKRKEKIKELTEKLELAEDKNNQLILNYGSMKAEIQVMISDRKERERELLSEYDLWAVSNVGDKKFINRHEKEFIEISENLVDQFLKERDQNK